MNTSTSLVQSQLRIARDSQTQKFCLDVIISTIESGNLQMLLDAGLPPELLDEIRQLKSFEVTRLIQLDLGFGLIVNPNVLSHQIGRLKQQLDEQRTQELFIARGCPSPLAMRLFRMQKRDVADMRLRMGVSTTTHAVQLDAALRRRIEDAWLSHRPNHFSWSNTPDLSASRLEAQAWMALLEDFPEVHLTTIYRTVLKFERFGKEESQ